VFDIIKRKLATLRRMRDALSELDRIYHLFENLENLPFEIQDRVNRGQIRLPNVCSIEETMSKLLKGHCSLSRFGEGEFRLALGTSIEFQGADPILQQRLKEILRTESEKVLIGIPDVFGSLAIHTSASREFWREYLLRNRDSIYALLNFAREHHDANITRPYYMFTDKAAAAARFRQLRRLWENKRILIVEGANTRLGRGNDLLHQTSSIERIICPAVNAFERYEEILDITRRHAADRLVLIALGPTATVLAHDLAQEGLQAIDIGHIDIEYEWFLRGAMTKIPIPGKHVNEARAPGDLNRVADELLESQVVARIL
jgi:glycosyltransferase family protein